jgi:uncharacterized protein YciI
MIFAHVAVTAADDALTRRAPYREAHLGRLAELRARGFLIGAGPSPDARSADLFVRVPDADAIRRLIEEDPYYAGGVWKRYAAVSFSQFLGPWRLPPVVTDGSRPATIVEGRTADPDMAALALVELRGQGRQVLGGLFPDGGTVAVMASADQEPPIRWLAETGFWEPASLAARPFLYVL